MGAKRPAAKPVLAKLPPPPKALAAIKARAVAAGFKPTTAAVMATYNRTQAKAPAAKAITKPSPKPAAKPAPKPVAASYKPSAEAIRLESFNRGQARILRDAFGPPHPQPSPRKAPPPSQPPVVTARATKWPGGRPEDQPYKIEPYQRGGPGRRTVSPPAPKFVPSARLDASQVRDRRGEEPRRLGPPPRTTPKPTKARRYR